MLIGSGSILVLVLLPFVAVAVGVALAFRELPVWRRIAGGVLVSLALLLVIGAFGYVGFAQGVGLSSRSAFPVAIPMGLGGVLVGAAVSGSLRWRTG